MGNSILADMIVLMTVRMNGLPVLRTDIIGSRTCSTCGRTQYSRMGTECSRECAWLRSDPSRHGTRLLQTAASKRLEVAGGLRFDPGAFQHDVMMTLYDPEGGARSEPNGTSCNCGGVT
jgi:hypothetical protein